MTVENIKALLDACYQAKRVRELLPVLPKGVTVLIARYLGEQNEKQISPFLAEPQWYSA